jgi:hypothetical protein
VHIGAESGHAVLKITDVFGAYVMGDLILQKESGLRSPDVARVRCLIERCELWALAEANTGADLLTYLDPQSWYLEIANAKEQRSALFVASLPNECVVGVVSDLLNLAGYRIEDMKQISDDAWRKTGPQAEPETSQAEDVRAEPKTSGIDN